MLYVRGMISIEVVSNKTKKFGYFIKIVLKQYITSNFTRLSVY
jgi:hypothetical protein